MRLKLLLCFFLFLFVKKKKKKIPLLTNAGFFKDMVRKGNLNSARCLQRHTSFSKSDVQDSLLTSKKSLWDYNCCTVINKSSKIKMFRIFLVIEAIKFEPWKRGEEQLASIEHGGRTDTIRNWFPIMGNDCYSWRYGYLAGVRKLLKYWYRSIWTLLQPEFW